MRFKQYITEKAIITDIKEVGDVLSVIDLARNNINKLSSTNKFLDFINNNIKKHTDKNIVFHAFDEDNVSIHGNIDARKKPYVINIYFSKHYIKNLNDNNVWNNFFNGIVSTLKHEITHLKQLSKVNDKYWDNKNFPKRVVDSDDNKTIKKNISHKHEIMAYAQSIIVDLIHYFGIDKNRILKFLKHYKSGISIELDRYISLFDKNDKTIKLLYRYMYDIIMHDDLLNMEK